VKENGQMKKYNHGFELIFDLVSNTEDGSDITISMLREALLAKIADMDQSDTWFCCQPTCDAYEEESQ
jgi:hypothetical protein